MRLTKKAIFIHPSSIIYLDIRTVKGKETILSHRKGKRAQYLHLVILRLSLMNAMFRQTNGSRADSWDTERAYIRQDFTDIMENLSQGKPGLNLPLVLRLRIYTCKLGNLTS